MTIYIESFLIQNILINLSLLRLITVSMKPKTHIVRLFVASIIGSAFSVISSVFLSNSIAINIIKLLCAITMLLIAFKQTKKQFIISFLLLFLFTYTFGGLIMNFARIRYTTNFGIIMSSKISLELICIIFIVGTYIYENIIKHLKFKIKTNNLIYKITLYCNKKKLHLNAYLDTGNFLNLDGKPILIVDIDTYLKLTNKSLIDFYLEKGEFISTGTVTGSSNLKLIKIDKLELKYGKENKIYTEQYIAVNNSNIFKNTNYQALLTPLFL